MNMPLSLLLLLLALLQGSATAQETYQVHGSGTSNPAPLLWKVADTLTARSKPAAVISYRSVGSGSGQSDLDVGAATSKNAFGCGDYPLSTAKWQSAKDAGNPALHFPLLVGTLSIFAHTPKLRLPPCVLVEVFSGQITRWDDAKIKAENPDVDLPDKTIKVVHRAAGSSSTSALTNYLREASVADGCPVQWPANEVGSTVSPNTWAQERIEVPNSQKMVDTLESTDFTIGYVESNQGIKNGLNEVFLRNKDGTYLQHNGKDTAIVSDAVLDNVFPSESNSVEQDWSAVSLINRPGKNTWPLALISYCYLRKDITDQVRNSGLTKFFINHMLSDEVADLAPSFGFVPMTKAKRTSFQTQLDSLVAIDPTSEWTLEVDTDDAAGQGDRVISVHRESHVLRALDTLSADVTQLKSKGDGTGAPAANEQEQDQSSRISALEASLQDQISKADMAMNVAVAAIIIGGVLGVLGVLLGVIALVKVGKKAGMSGGGSKQASKQAGNPTFEIA